MANPRRTHRISERIQAVVANELIRMADPRFHLVTITSVQANPDLRLAKVYWMVHGDAEKQAETKDAFTGAAGHFRKLLAYELDLRFTPEVRFYYDDTFDEQERMERIFDSIRMNQK